MTRRGEADPLLLQAVSARLARLLAETQPQRAVDEQTADLGAASIAAPETELVEVDDVPAPRRFGRLHLGVVCLLLIAGLLGAGWSVLRARPVAIAAPVAVSALPSSPSTAGSVTATPSLPAASPATTTAGPTPVGAVVVHVLGAVRRPGLVTLAMPARVQDAVDAAGGFSRDADPGELNLAQLLQDGQQVVIGTAARPTGEVRGSGSSGGAGAGGDATAASGTGPTGSEQPLDLNAATEPQFEELPSVGPVTAGKIISWRTEHGRFSRIEELQEVDGIGPKTYAQIAPHVRV